MKQGIHLGPPPARSSLPVLMALLVVAAAAAVVLALIHQRTRSEVRALEREVRSLEEAREPSAQGPGPEEARRQAERLRLVLGSGASDTVSPTDLIRLVDGALPEGVVLGRLSFSAAPEPVLMLEASTMDGDRITELERRLRASPSVATTSLLEERRLADGRLGLRLQVDLATR
jgi:hypothetical protein